jgi:ribosomal protein S18 acetylase RimI-like enzyme
MHSQPQLRPARSSDAADLACLVDSASRGLALWLWTRFRSPGQSAIEVGRQRILTLTASPTYFATFTITEVGGAVVGALTGRLIPIPYARGDSADLPDPFAPLLELEAVASGSWYLNIIAVYPEFRGIGIGSMLLGRAEELARAAGASQISLIVEESNAGAHKLYLRHGFVEWARRRNVPFPGSTDEGDLILLRKDVT